jgi:hypothetical protein
MCRRVIFWSVIALLASVAATAQRQPLFDPDDFVDPREHVTPVLASRLVIGAAANLTDHYRPLRQDAGFVHLANSFYWKRWQFDYKHSEVRGSETNGPIAVKVCGCVPPVYFPTGPPHDATPDAPPPGRTETLQVGFYRMAGGAPAEPPITLRTRLWGSRRPVGTVVTNPNTNEVVERRSGHEQSFGLDTDTHIRFGQHDIWGSILFTRTSASGTIDNRSQNELAYTNRFPAIPVRQVMLRTMLTVGGISGRGGTALNLVSPYFEAFFHHDPSRANVHLVWNPQWTRSGVDRQAHQQVALFIDYGLVKLLH